MTTSQYTTPVVVDLDGLNIEPLESLSLLAAGSGGYDEDWLQNLLFQQPGLLPIGDIEPAFETAVPVCRELPTGVGPLDLVYINRQGLLTFVECKLWRNPEARRKVVGQILDYAQEISRWSYEQLDAAVAGSYRHNGKSLWEIARDSFGLTDEAVFIDRVIRHLKSGTFLLLIVGDGIRESTENIAGFLRDYAGLSFAFGLVEQSMFLIPGTSRILVQPRVLAKTVELGRLIVRAEPGVVIESESRTPEKVTKTQPTLTEAILIEEIAGTSDLSHQLRELFTRLREEGFRLEPLKTGLKVIPDGFKLNLLVWERQGTVRNYGCGDSDLGRSYLERLAALLPDAMVTAPKSPWESTVAHADGSPIRTEEMIAIAESWLDLIKDVKQTLLSTAEGE